MVGGKGVFVVMVEAKRAPYNERPAPFPPFLPPRPLDRIKQHRAGPSLGTCGASPVANRGCLASARGHIPAAVRAKRCGTATPSSAARWTVDSDAEPQEER